MGQVVFLFLLLLATPTLASMSSGYGEHDECPQPQSADWVDNGEQLLQSGLANGPCSLLTPPCSSLRLAHSVHVALHLCLGRPGSRGCTLLGQEQAVRLAAENI